MKHSLDRHSYQPLEQTCFLLLRFPSTACIHVVTIQSVFFPIVYSTCIYVQNLVSVSVIIFYFSLLAAFVGFDVVHVHRFFNAGIYPYRSVYAPDTINVVSATQTITEY